MAHHHHAPFEIHVHGDIAMQAKVRLEDIQAALKPLWKYTGAGSLREGGISQYEEEPGICFDAKKNMLHICWTVRGRDDFRHVIEEICFNINELTSAASAIEVTFYDIEFDNDSNSTEHKEGSRDDFMLVFVGPTPAAIMQAQRDLLVRDVSSLMQRHFASTELDGVIHAVDKLFTQRFDALVTSLELGRPPKELPSSSNNNGHRPNGHKPRHLH